MKIFQTNHLPGRTVQTSDGSEYLWFSGTDYLGMGHDESFRSYLQEGIDAYGLHFGASRNNSLRLDIYEEAELHLANWIGTPTSLLISSGMWAGQLVMKCIENIVHFTSSTSSVQYHYAPKAHPAIWGNNLKISGDHWIDWAYQVIDEIIHSSTNTAHVICTDAIGSPMVEAFDFSVFANLPSGRNIWIVVDASHTLGVHKTFGKDIYQLIEGSGKANVIMVSSLNKALGIPGGVIACERSTYDLLHNAPWFAGASPPAPGYIYALSKLLETNRFANVHTMLSANIDYFNQKLIAQDLFVCAPGYPVFCSRNPLLFDHLLGEQIMTSCFSYPSANDTPVTRIAISAIHQKEDLNRLAEVCNSFKSSFL
ncbi:aminotransferase class I/II-fold pyridoxal phosphate-dependent enzyme [Dyadobacter chenwenxiniae]|uniref:Aminotransferase class I/II-fold pyridoxal phosphate-dependent enzyme n=1 Tax=Dyadobacter chenwenxiniae TaxID=2906456 RepID=A0A9X1PJD5_9BACT|nr:aminotransferase class I/II-fold pyridoxal phosphate-dependent enzyme [Dyadobacter chenwenxiniae]MCF0062130.1 aminotransferase class I/II-fold pyridoxal phosphate-dependent enzyme [Dyadobacter chenwenxiniae]UON81934.1 aminotransferase class I/II-fold pyridoxal phosphate-dependent enzyme [Dyadobacter chenwenxiniae]